MGEGSGSLRPPAGQGTKHAALPRRNSLPVPFHHTHLPKVGMLLWSELPSSALQKQAPLLEWSFPPSCGSGGYPAPPAGGPLVGLDPAGGRLPGALLRLLGGGAGKSPQCVVLVLLKCIALFSAYWVAALASAQPVENAAPRRATSAAPCPLAAGLPGLAGGAGAGGVQGMQPGSPLSKEAVAPPPSSSAGSPGGRRARPG